MSFVDYEINKELGECYLFMGELDKAEEHYLKASTAATEEADAYIGLATVAVHRTDLANAETFYQKACDLRPCDKALSGLGLVANELKESEAAFGYFEKALQFNSDNLVALLSIVRLAHELEKLETIVPFLNAYLELNPAQEDVRYTLAGCLVCLNLHQEAKEHLSILLEKNPNNAIAQELMSQI